MDSFRSNQSDPQEPVDVDDLKRDLSSDFNKLQQSSTEEREHLKVYLRVRPFTSAESSGGESQECVTIEHPDAVLLKLPGVSIPSRVSRDKSLPQTGQRFQFSQVYGPETTQTTLFRGTVKDLVKDVLEGGNSLVFTYGVTNAGKTFTFLGPDADAGILPRSLHMIFSSIDGRVFPAASVKPHRCQEFSRLSRVQQAEDATFKRNLFRQLKENDKTNVSLLNSTYKPDLQGSDPEPIEDRIVLHVDPNTTFSVWVSFCEIYNENIHDLLEAVPGGALRRPALRLSQDIKGNAYVKDVRWVQVNSAQEAHGVMTLGKKNQSCSSTRLNQLSSRSHSIFSIRILRIEDVAGNPRVHAVSELCLCDLAGSERCAKTQNKGDRLKEAGNINTSLLILGKVINALRHNQQTKLLQHVPFRESKLTHYLQSFFCGRGAAACMIVNINQCASMYDETLNVLKFSAVAQKVVVLSSRAPPIAPQRSSSDVSFAINNAEKKTRRCSSLIGWESSLEDVQEDDDDDDDDDEGSLMDEGNNEEDDDNEDDVLVNKKTHERQVALLRDLQMQLKQERAENLLMEARIREEVSREFTELFTEMRANFDERLVRESEMLEERAEHRLEIFKNLVKQMSAAGPSQDPHAMESFLDSFSSQFVGEGKLSEGGPGLHVGGPPAAGDDEQSRNLLSQLQDKSSQCLELEKRVETLELNSERLTRQLQDALTALECAKQSREETLAALEYQTTGKEEALSAQREELRVREELELRVERLRQRAAELQAAVTVLKVEREEANERINAAQLQVVTATQTDDHFTEQVVMAQEQLDQRWQEVQDKSSEILKLQQELEELKQQVGGEREELKQQVEQLKQELHAAKITSVCARDELREEADELKRELCQEREKRHGTERRVQQLEGEREELMLQGEELKQQLEGEREELKLHGEVGGEREELKQQVEQLKQELHAAKITSVCARDELREEADELKRELCQEREKRHSTERRVQQLEGQREELKQQQEELKLQLEGEREELKLQGEELKQQQLEGEREELKLQQEELKQEQLEGEREELKQQLEGEREELKLQWEELKQQQEELKLQWEELKLQREKLKQQQQLEGEREELKCQREELKLQVEELTERLRQREEESTELLKEKLQEQEVVITSLQKDLEQRQQEEEHQKITATERRRELLAVAHEAIAQKDDELQRRAEEINSLKQSVQQQTQKAEKLSVDLQRREDDSSDLREKLSDYKKQMEQVQKEISTMRENEKCLKQKLSDGEKNSKQLQSELAIRDRSIQQLRAAPSGIHEELHQKACRELEAKGRAMEGMRLALTEQEETQQQMETMLEEKLSLIHQLHHELEQVKAKLLQNDGGVPTASQSEASSDDITALKREAARTEETLKTLTEKHQAERRKWQEEKLSLIGQAKEAEDKRNQEMRKFADDRERSVRQQGELESQLRERDQSMDQWRKERDTLVAALEVQLQKLLSSQAEKDALITRLRCSDAQTPPEVGPTAAQTQTALTEEETHVSQLNTELEETKDDSPGGRSLRASVSSQSSASGSAVLDSFEISTETGRCSRFPKPELEIAFSSLQPHRMALRRRGEESAVTVKITRSGRKRKSTEMEKSHIFFRSSKRKTRAAQDDVDAENRKNTGTKMTPYQEESFTPTTRLTSQSSRKDGALQKIGHFLHSSPTLLSSKAKKMMSLVSPSPSSSSSSSSSLRGKKKKRKLYMPEISSPMEVSPLNIIREPEEKESDHQIMKRRLRSTMGK